MGALDSSPSGRGAGARGRPNLAGNGDSGHGARHRADCGPSLTLAGQCCAARVIGRRIAAGGLRATGHTGESSVSVTDIGSTFRHQGQPIKFSAFCVAAPMIWRVVQLWCCSCRAPVWRSAPARLSAFWSPSLTLNPPAGAPGDRDGVCSIRRGRQPGCSRLRDGGSDQPTALRRRGFATGRDHSPMRRGDLVCAWPHPLRPTALAWSRVKSATNSVKVSGSFGVHLTTMKITADHPFRE